MSERTAIVLTNFIAMNVNAANTGAGARNDDGSFNVWGTVVGVLQTTHSVLDFVNFFSKLLLARVGIALGVPAVIESLHGIQESFDKGLPPNNLT